MKKFLFPFLSALSVCALARDNGGFPTADNGNFFSADYGLLAAAIPARSSVPQNAQPLTPVEPWQGVQYPVFKKETPKSGAPETSLEFNYLYQMADFYWKNESLSRLTWRDVALRGGELKLKTRLGSGQDFVAGASYVTSASGYSTDDDLDNMALIISWGPVDASETAAYAFWSVAQTDSATAFLGLRFKRGAYNMRQPYRLDSTGAWYMPGMSGNTQEYTFYTFGPSVGVDADILKNANFRFSINGDLGLQLYYAEADWPYRGDLQHPDSFDDLGAVVNINAAFKLEWMLSKNFSLTGSAGLDYFRNPFIMRRTIHSVYGDLDDHLSQVIYSNLKTSLGVKISF